MIKVNSVSGGKTSAYIAMNYPADYDVFSLVCIDDPLSTPKDKSLVDYVNAKLEKFTPLYGEFIATAEDDRTLVAMRDLEQLMGKEIIWVRGESFDDVIDKGTKTRLPSWARRYCTEQMKLLPIFMWWFHNIGEKCEMRIGFRANEYDRMERFFNNSNPSEFSIPTSCSLRGQKRQRHETFKWRTCHMPLIKDQIFETDIKAYWADKWVGENDLFNAHNRHRIEFPEISNCVGCFHKKVQTLAVMSNMHPEKMNWFARQEDKNMGTWLDSRMRYDTIANNAENWIPEMINDFGACDSGGCTD